MFTKNLIAMIFIASFFLGLIKYGSLASQYKGKSWQLKFIEIWNDFINFLISGLIGYYFVSVRWISLSSGEIPSSSDLVLLIILILGLFGHLSVMSKNITEGIQAILRKVLD